MKVFVHAAFIAVGVAGGCFLAAALGGGLADLQNRATERRDIMAKSCERLSPEALAQIVDALRREKP